MSWPLASHFSAMLQNPRVAFRDPRLQAATIEKNEQNQPRPWAGAFAVVYKGLDPERGPFALRIFTTESSERRERYDQISAYLKGRKLKCLVDFDYCDRSIRSAGDGKWYPLIVMEWVQGETLFQWLKARSLEGNRDAIAQAADRWLELVQEMADASVAHGDLQHANIMVTPTGDLKLVDYDGMCVPSLVGRRNLEVGVEPYQHPGRSATTLLSLDLDNFSALMIYVALRALAIQPALWMKYVEQQGYDKLLFRREDFQSPGQSPLNYDLAALGNPDLRALTDKLFELSQKPMEDVPPLGQLSNSYAEVERLLTGRQWSAAVALLNRRGHFRDAPAALQPLIHKAYEHVCRKEAWARFSKIPLEISEPVDRQLAEAWNEALFAGYAAAEKHRMRVAEARRRVQLLDRLRHLIQRAAGKISLSGEKGLVVTASGLPQGYPYSLKPRVRTARRRVASLVRLERALADSASEAAIVAAWQGVVEAKCEALVGIDSGMRIALAEERSPIFQTLAKIPRDLPLDERDGRVLAVWNDKLMADCPEAEKWRPVYQMAMVRREVLKRLQAAVEAHDDAAVVQWGGKRCLAKYPLPQELVTEVQAAGERLGQVESLVALLREAATATAAACGEGVSPAPETGEAAEGMPVDEPALAEPVAHEAEPVIPGAEPVVHGESAAGMPVDEPALAEPVPPGAEPVVPEAEPVPPGAEPVVPEAEPATSADDARRAAFRGQFDARRIRANPDQFAPYQAQLAEWIGSEFRTPEQLGLTPPPESPALSPVEEPEGHYRAEWSWPEPRLVDQCVLAVCAAEPGPDDDPETIEVRWRAVISREEWTAGGGNRLIPIERGWEGSCVAVWAIVDVGFRRIASRPLVLGQIEPRSRWKWSRLFSRRSEEETV